MEYFVRAGGAKLEIILVNQSIFPKTLYWKELNIASFVVVNIFIPAMPTIIEVNHLTKKFKDVIAVNDLSFTVNEGDVYGFLGQNGAGKSTTIRMLLTLIKPTSGNISVFEKDLFTSREAIFPEQLRWNFLTKGRYF